MIAQKLDVLQEIVIESGGRATRGFLFEERLQCRPVLGLGALPQAMGIAFQRVLVFIFRYLVEFGLLLFHFLIGVFRLLQGSLQRDVAFALPHA